MLVDFRDEVVDVPLYPTPSRDLYTWEDDDEYRTVTITKQLPTMGKIMVLTIPVTEDGIFEASELQNVLDQVKQYIAERLG